MKKLLAIASGGGHLDELMVVRKAFGDFEVVYATTFSGQAERDGVVAEIINDSNRHTRAAFLRTAWDIVRVMLKVRPAVVITTGAMPGLIAVLLGRLFGARTVWIDSVANAEEISMSGRVASRIVHLHLTQWKHLTGKRTQYFGSVL